MTAALRWLAIGMAMGAAGCDPTARLAPASEGAASDADPTLPNEAPLPWVDDSDSSPGDTDDTGDIQPTSTVVDVVVGDRTSCLRASDGTLDCWGYNRDGAASEPSGRYRSVASAGLWSCAVGTDDALTCWGDVSGALLSPPTGRFVGVALGSGAACAWTANGDLSCWGDLAAPPETLPDVSQAVVGSRFACAAGADGGVVCFGRGELDAPDGLSATTLVAGSDHACALDADGVVTCWGANDAGQLDVPDEAFTVVAASGDTSCGVASGAVTCWGAAAEDLSPEGLPSLQRLSIGASHACGLDTRGGVVCWGDDRYAQASAPAAGVTQVRMAPERFGCQITASGAIDCFGDGAPVGSEPVDGGATDLAVGFRHACVLNGDGDDACWGNTFGGRIALPAEVQWRDLALSDVGGCGLRKDGALQCWGDDFDGVPVLDGPFSSVAGGAEHAVALAPAGDFACVGVADGGRCDGPPGETFDQLDAGEDTTCGITKGGVLACFGATTGLLDPPDGTFVDVSVAGDHACAVDDAGAVKCWGKDAEGETVPPSGTFTQVSTGATTTCAVTTSRRVVCWGYLAR